MQRLEVICAVRHIYIYMSLGAKGLNEFQNGRKCCENWKNIASFLVRTSWISLQIYFLVVFYVSLFFLHTVRCDCNSIIISQKLYLVHIRALKSLHQINIEKCTHTSLKVKVLPVQATKALRVGRGIALPFLRPRNWRWCWGISTTPLPLYPRGKDPVPIV